MSTNPKEILKRIRFYILLLGAFLGIEIPLFIFTYFKYFSKYRQLVWVFSVIIGMAAAFLVFYLINGIINEDYETKLLFDNTDYSISEDGGVDEEI